MESISSINTNSNNVIISALSENQTNQKIFNKISEGTQVPLPDSTIDQTESLGSKLWNIFFTSASVKAPTPTLSASVTTDNKITVTTADGYKINVSTKDAEWIITSPDNKGTRIFGDPHVEESDGDKWDFFNQSTFIFGNNKVTVEVKDLGNGTTVSKTISIYNGNDRMTITGINDNLPKIVDWKFDGNAHDTNLKDGDVYRLNTSSDGKFLWAKS